MDGIPSHAIYSQQFRRCGKPECSRCAPGLPGHGPYWYARWQQHGRTHSHYLGKAIPSSGTASVSAHPLGAEPAALRVRTLGTFAVWRGTTAIPANRWARRTVCSLFKCLLGAPRQSLDRAQVIDLLWPTTSPDRGAVNLRTVVHRLRGVLDGPRGTRHAAGSYLRTEGSLLVLDPLPGGAAPSGWFDAAAFADAAAAALASTSISACQQALAPYGGDYLADDLYSDWVIGMRERLRESHCSLLLHLGQLYTETGALEQAIAVFRALLAADPSREAAARSLMQLLDRLGRRTEALRVYASVVRVLQTDLGVQVMPETVALYRMIVRPIMTAHGLQSALTVRRPAEHSPAEASLSHPASS